MAQLNPGLLGLIGAPTFPMLRDATERLMFEILDEEEIPYRFRKQEKSLILLENGSEILFRSLDDPEHLRGPNLAWFGIDEMTYCKPEVWSRLEARVRHPKAIRPGGFACWTPKGFDHVHEMFIGEPKRGFIGVRAAPFENYHNAAGYYDRLKDSYDERFYNQEVLGEYLNVFSGQVYYAFDRRENVKSLEWDPLYPICWTLDFNVDPMCSLIAQVIDTTTRSETLIGHRSLRVNVLDELYLMNSNTPAACQEFANRTERFLAPQRRLSVALYGDAAGSARQTASAGAASDWEVIRRFFAGQASYAPSYRYKAADPRVRDRVAAVNGACCNSVGDRRLFIDPRCKRTIRDFEQVSWKEGTTLIDKDSDANLTHLSDAVGYLIDTELGLKAAGGYRGGYIA